MLQLIQRYIIGKTKFFKLRAKRTQQLPTTTFLFFRGPRSVTQYWIRLYSSFITVKATHAHYTGSPRSLQILMGCILPTMHYWSNILGSCCIRFHTTANTDATTSNMAASTMLGVVASVHLTLNIPNVDT